MLATLIPAVFVTLWLALAADTFLTAYNNGYSEAERLRWTTLVVITGPIGWALFEFSDGMEQSLEE